MSDKDKSLPVNVDIGAKAEAKLAVETRVPEESSGRLVDALTDLIRPWSEARGLKADQLRLQREEVLVEIVKKARDKRILGAEEYKYIPTKILVPLLEAASLEDPKDTEMHERWANLLVSSSADGGIEPRFVSILKEITGRQARLLHEIAFQSSQFSSDYAILSRHFERIENVTDEMSVRSFKARVEVLLFEEAHDSSRIFTTLLNDFNRPGCMVRNLQVEGIKKGDAEYFDKPDDWPDLDFEILLSLGLLTRINELTDDSGSDAFIWADYFLMTELGSSFLWDCTHKSVTVPNS